MHKTLPSILTAFLLTVQLGLAQTQPQRLPAALGLPGTPGLPSPAPNLTKFDLDFPGGTPEDLVRAIEKASGRPLNAIIPKEYESPLEHFSPGRTNIPPLILPALKMKRVDVAQLFEALKLASTKTVTYETGHQFYGGGMQRPMTQTFISNYGFKTQGTPTDDSIWYFYFEKPARLEEPKNCRFWSLNAYLSAFKIEDITTAIQTGCSMLGQSTPTMNFHKDTRLLIAVGEDDKLKLIDSVLAELEREIRGPKPNPPSQPVKHAETAK
ncbi:MAG: hypothetical protein HYY23_14060 [Verrucomicrobia bacterium]|nr:hypothetical protein [Verrucomicrobiota bacterium]